VRTVADSFDPAHSPEALRVVRERRAKIGALIDAGKLKAETVWHVLGLCGMKKEITWEDAVDEAGTIVQDGSVERSRLLFERLNQQHSKLLGSRAACLSKLKEIPWAPVVEANPASEPKQPSKLLALKEVFPEAARKLVWAVAPSLCLVSAVDELRPGRKVEDEPDVLVDQVRALADGVASNGKGTPAYAPAETLEHLKVVFGALLGLLSKLKNFKEHPKLKGVAFVPCQTTDESDKGAWLFASESAAFQAHRKGSELSPVIGLVKQADQTIKMIAEAAGVAKEPRSEMLMQALAKSGAAAPGLELAVALASELAARTKAQGKKLEHAMVPTVKGTIESMKHVFINDAPWWHQRGVVTLHPGVTAEEGSILGCTSLREEMARRCEGKDAAPAPSKEEATNEAEGVSKLRKLLQEFGDGANIISEFVQNCDGAGAGSVAFFLMEEAFPGEKILDPRASPLQGAALYVCSDKALSAEDVKKMQAMGHLREDARPGCLQGDFGVGLSFMYRYSDCPQLLSGKRVHFFDLSRGFAARPGMAWGRHFSQEQLKEDFPDSYAPFEAKLVAGKFPTVFRLALRTKRSDLGLNLELSTVREELRKAAASGDKTLLFTRSVRRLEFRDGDALVAAHEKSTKDSKGYAAFCSGLRAPVSDLKSGEFVQHLAHKTVKTQLPETAASAEWVVIHRMGVKDDAMKGVVKELAGKGGRGALPHAAAAFRVSPVEEDLQGGKVCCGSPLPLGCNASAWVSAGFALPPSRKTLPLPEPKDSKPSPDQRWNKMLLEGPVAESIQGLVTHCTEGFLSKSLSSQGYFSLFPKPGDLLQSILSSATVSLDWIASTLVNPETSQLSSEHLASLTLGLLEWAGSWKESEVKELSQKLASTKWLPTEDGSLRTICDVFDPAIPVKAFRIVKDKLAKIDGLIENMKLDAPTVWRVLRLCGIKQDITWEDAVDEAEIIAAESDLDAAKGFLAHLNKCHSSMKGSRADALRKLQGLAWAPAMQPCSGQEPKDSLKLTLLKDVYPQSARKLTWAVAPALCMESAVSELKPGLSVDANAEVLVDQIRALAGSVESTPGAPPLATAALVEHLRTAFGALLPLLPKLSKPLAEHPKLSDVAFVPCFPLEEDDGCAALFVPGRAAFQAQHAHRALYPVVGIVKPADSTQKMIAEAAGVAKEPRAPALAEALRGAPKGDLGVALAIELAARIRAKEETPDNIMVPTAGGTIQPVNEVFIDDAPWKHRASRITTLNARISAEDGAILGCTSLRDEMARQAEDEEGATEADKAAQEEDGFGQEADLVAQVKQLLQEYGDHADLVQEFVQNTDDAGAREMAFFLDESEFGKETIVDSRAAELQGPALYIGSDKPLTAYDIGRMQCVGNSAKRMDWTSSGRFGVGLNVMYRYCDCPQLMANDRLHFFDLTRSFVAHGGGKRGRQFTVQKLRENFPDNHSPFEIDMAKRFPTIFRMALRPKRSDLGVKMPLTTIREELKMAADLADKMLLFAKNLRKLEFWDGKKLIAAHEANLQDREGYESYMKSLPKSPIDLKPGVFNSYLGSKIITTERSVQVAEGDDEEKAAPAKVTAEWALSFRVGITDDKMFRVLKEQFEQPHGVALLPSAAAAVKVSPVETGKREGRICSGLPTPFRSNSSAWINGAFALLSSRKTLPLPEEKDQRPSLDKAWNRMLLQGPAAEAMRGLICHSTSLVLYRGFTIDQYFEIFPLRGDRLQSILAISTLKAAVKEAMFPVSRTDKVSWVAGPAPLFKTKELPEDVQEELIADGMKLVYLPDKLLIEYEEALGRPKSVLKAEDLCTFLKETWAKLHPDKDPSRVKTGDAFDDFTKEDLTLEDGSKEVDFDNTGIASLATKEYVTKLLAFAMKGLWASQCKAEKEKKDPETKFAVRALVGVPLLLTHQQCLTPFGLSTKFNSWRDILPAKKNLFIDRELHIAAMDVVDVGLAGASDLVIETTLPGVRPFTLKDLLPFRDAVEASFDASSGFMDGPNESLRQFWSLVADTFAQSLQVNANLGQAAFMKARAAAAGEKAESLIQLKNDASWSKDIMDWRVLPICSSEGLGESGENLVPLSQGGKCVALTLVSQDESIIDSLTGILQECGVDTVQHDIMSDDRIQRLIRTLVVTTNEDMLDLLITHGKIENLSALQRHELLAYFSMLCVKGGVRLDAVRKLALFKTIDVDTKFVAFKDGMKYACIDPNDPHAASLSKLSLKGLTILAWPTQQVKPMYEYCDVKLCNGEEFMCSEIIPLLPSLIAEDPDGSASKPFLMELHAYCCKDDRASNVRQIASDTAFVPSEDLSRMAEPRSFTSPAGSAAGLFREVLSSHLPVGWMASNLYMMELLQQLGMEMVLTPPLILLCAQDLDDSVEHIECGVGQSTGDALDEELRLKSFELVEEWARAAEEVWPKPKPGEALGVSGSSPPANANVDDMTALLKAASLRIFMARRHSNTTTKGQDAKERNSKRQKSQVKHAEVELVPLKGTAFKTARQVLWTSCPLGDHRSKEGAKDSHYMKELLEKHPKGMFGVFGAYSAEEQAPFAEVTAHLANLCRLQRSPDRPDLASVKSESLLHEDFRACWKHLAEGLSASTEDDGESALERSGSMDKLRELPCISVSLEDVGSAAVELTSLTLPRYSFFQLPLFKGKEANMRQYLRQVHAETAKEASVFRALGASDKPRAPDYASASERIAAKADELGRADFEWISACLEACVRGAFEDLTDAATRASDKELDLSSLHLFTQDMKIKRATTLIWADEPRWLKRCEKADLSFWAGMGGTEGRDIADCLVKYAGMKQLTALVEERRMVEDDDEGEADNLEAVAFKDNVEQMVQSNELACGLHAVIRHTAEDRSIKSDLAEVSAALRTIKFVATKTKLRSALYWKTVDDSKKEEKKEEEDDDEVLDVEGGSEKKRRKIDKSVITGSELEQQVYFDEKERAVYIGDARFGSATDAFTAELIFALRRALPLLFHVDQFLLEALARCALQEGPSGIPPFLEKRDIPVDILLAPRHLGPGDRLPAELQDHLQWAMDATFGEGETVSVLVGDVFTIAEVAKWPGEQQTEEGLMRSYYVRITASKFEKRKHFEVYKIQNKGSKAEKKGETSTELALKTGGEEAEAKDGIAEEAPAEAETNEDDEKKQLRDVIEYLKEMGKMEPADYKAVMRRLFKTWHPDKVGDTPIANRIFHLLRTHEAWYKRKAAGEAVADDSWLDSAGLDPNEKPEGDLLAIESGEAPKEAPTDGQGSWFHEFEKEMLQAKEDRDAGKTGRAEDDDKGPRVVKPPNATVGPDGQVTVLQEEIQSGPPRIVDKQLAPRFLKEAQLELHAARRLMKDYQDGFSCLHPRAVFHCQQAVEMALRSAMLRTCGVAEDEVAGGAAHDLIDFIKRIKTAEVNTDEQKRAAAELPLGDQDVEWLKHAYLASRYPKPGRYGVPALLYGDAEAERALKLAEDFLKWAASVEDLPDPSKFRRKRWAGDNDNTLPGEQPSVNLGAAQSFSPSVIMQIAAGQGVTVPPPAGRGVTVAPPKRSSSDVGGAEPTGTELKRQKSDAGLEPGTKVTKRWARKS